MKKRQDKKNPRQRLIDWLKYRIRLLEAEKQNFALNLTFMKNVKTANIEIIQNEIETLRRVLNEVTPDFALREPSLKNSR